MPLPALTILELTAEAEAEAEVYATEAETVTESDSSYEPLRPPRLMPRLARIVGTAAITVPLTTSSISLNMSSPKVCGSGAALRLVEPAVAVAPGPYSLLIWLWMAPELPSVLANSG